MRGLACLLCLACVSCGGPHQAVPADAKREPWLFRHPDGRRWIGYKAGTYIVDQAMKHSGQTPAQLVVMPTHEVLTLSRLAVAPTVTAR